MDGSMNIATLFPGQGAQYEGMGKWLCDNFELARRTFEQASDCIGMDVSQICLTGGENLIQTSITQPAVLTVSVAAAKIVMEELGYSFRYGAGHSLGEYSALTVAGGLEFSDALKLVRLRGQYMQEAIGDRKGAMCVVHGYDREKLKEIMYDMKEDDMKVEISNYNSPYQIVVSGLQEDIEKFTKKMELLHISTIRLKVTTPFHCSLMKPAKEKMAEALKDITIHPLKFPVLSNVTGVPYYNINHIRECLEEQITRPVEWRKCMQFLYAGEIDAVMDMGPGEVLKNLMRRNFSGIQSLSVERDWDTLVGMRR